MENYLSKSDKKTSRVDAVKWKQLITEWENGFESQENFCKKHGININTFSYMKQKLKKINKANSFVPVIVSNSDKANIEDTSFANANICIENKCGMKISLPARVSPEWFSQVLNLLGWNNA